MAVYTTSAEPPKITFGKTYIRIPTNIEEIESIDNELPPEGMKFYRYDETKLTYQQYQQLLATREEVELMQAETLVTVYEILIPGEGV